MRRRAAALVALASLASLTSCAQVWGLPDRKLDPHLDCASGTCVCQGGFDNCDGDDASGCETDLASNPKHCGACGHGCLGGGCAGGECQPVVLHDFGNQFPVFALGDAIYVGGCGPALASLPRTGGALSPLVIDGCTLALGLDGTNLFYGTVPEPFSMGTGAILTAPAGAASGPVTLVPGASPNGLLAAGGGFVYWGDQPTGGSFTLSRVAEGGGAPVVVDYPALGALTGITADADRVYWGSLELLSLPHGSPSGQMPDTIWPEAPVYGVSLANGSIYWAHGASIFSQPLAGGLPAGTPTSFEVGGQPLALAVDTAHAYWLDLGTGRMGRADLDGGHVAIIASGLDLPSVGAATIAVDADAVYFNTQSQILRVAK